MEPMVGATCVIQNPPHLGCLLSRFLRFPAHRGVHRQLPPRLPTKYCRNLRYPPSRCVPPEFLWVHLCQSKTDPFGKGVHIFLSRTSETICPVAAVLSFLAVRPHDLTGPLLRFPDGTTLTRDTLITQVRKALAATGHNPGNYNGHSFRIGAATAAVQAGVPDHQIKMLGRWETPAYTLYVRTPPSQLSALSARLMHPTSTD